MKYAVGTKFDIIKGGTLHVAGRPLKLKKGEIWDIVDSEVLGPQFRKLNQKGGSTCILNGQFVAYAAVDSGKARVLDQTDQKAVEHDALRARTGAR